MRDDFEHRLGQGLKRWAEAGAPTLDLEAAVGAQAGDELVPERPHRPWLRWFSLAASALVVAGGLFISFPVWAGTAANWPVIGPAVREIIMKDAGLNWAYTAGLMGNTLAEATDGSITVRVLGVAADQASTTVLYQITGYSGPEPGMPVPDTGLWSRLARPADTSLHVWVKKVPGTLTVFTTWNPPVETPIGLVGTVSTNAMGTESGPLELEVEVNGHRLPLSFVASRSAADRFSHTIPVHQSRTIAGITYSVDSVIQTPVQTVVRYTEAKPLAAGDYSAPGHQTFPVIESGGKTLHASMYYNDQDFYYAVFPRADLPARLAWPESAAGEARQLTWPLVKGADQEVEGSTVTLTGCSVRDNQLAAEWTFKQVGRFLAFGDFAVIDAAGTAYPVKSNISTLQSANAEYDLPQVVSYLFDLPPGVTPVAIRSQRITVAVSGPWTFELPAK